MRFHSYDDETTRIFGNCKSDIVDFSISFHLPKGSRADNLSILCVRRVPPFVVVIFDHQQVISGPFTADNHDGELLFWGLGVVDYFLTFMCQGSAATSCQQ